MRVLQLHNADPRGVVQAGGAFVRPLQDAEAATVRRVINGEYTLTVELASGARNLGEIILGRAIKAAVNEDGDEEFFIIKNRQRSLTGGWSVYAEHQSYLFNGVLIAGGDSYSNGQPRVVFQSLRTYAAPDITDISTWTYSRSNSLRANFPARPRPMPVMEALKKHLVGAAGGELIFRGFNVEYVTRMGQDRGAEYRYAVNLTEIESEDILDGYASGIFPFWGVQGSQDKPMTILPEKVITYAGTFPITYYVPVDLTGEFETQPTEAQLRTAAEDYAALHAPSGVPISIKVARVKLANDKPVDLGDTVTVVTTPWNLKQKTRIQAIEFDALRGRAERVELGAVNPGFAGAVKNTR